MKFDTLIAEKIYPNDKAVSLSIEDSEWFSQGDGWEYLIGTGLKISGVNVDLEESADSYADAERLADFGRKESICTIDAMLLACENMVQQNYEPYEVCDSYSGELEFIYSVLDEYELDYNEDILYIHDIEWQSTVSDDDKTRVINQLKGFMVNLFNIIPDLLCFYTQHTDGYQPEKILTDEKQKMMSNAIGDLFSPEQKDLDVINLGNYIHFTEEEITERLGKRNKGGTYPEEFINKAEYDEFIHMGFKEIGESRLLIKFI